MSTPTQVRAPFLRQSQSGCFSLALSLLHDAFEAAREARRGAWEFALEIAQLHAAGLSNTDLRRLLCAGLVERAVEQQLTDGASRTFRSLPGLALPPGSCFILTELGARAAPHLTRDTAVEEHLPPLIQQNEPHERSSRPRWDSTLRRLCWMGSVVKQFRVPAPNQETILSAFEEEGWPARLDDPLPQTDDVEPKARLREAVKALNRRQRHRLLQFEGDGTGQGLLWRAFRACPESPPDHHRTSP